MATAKPAAKTAAPKPAAKAAPALKKAPAPAPAPAPAEEETVELAEGTNIKFLGYGADVPADQQYLTADAVYTIAGFTSPDGDEGTEGYDPGGDPYVMIDNPDFNAKKKESDQNPRQIAVPVYEGEYEVTDEVPAEEAAAEEAAPAPAAKAPAATKAVGKAKTKAAAPAPTEETPPADEMPDLEGEDEEVLALVNGEANLIEVAQELEAAAAVSEYRLGGVLFHIKKGKEYLNVEGGEQYNVPGGFAAFLKDYFNVEYRKAMYLIDIYIAFTTAKIENPADAVARMGWAKASKIAVPMKDNLDQAADLIELANSNTVADLTVAIKEQVQVGGTREGGTKVTRTTLKFRLLENDGALVTQTLDAIVSAQGLKDPSEALVFLVNEYVNTQNPAAARTAPAQGTAVGKRAPAAKTAAPAAKRVAAK